MSVGTVVGHRDRKLYAKGFLLNVGTVVGHRDRKLLAKGFLLSVETMRFIETPLLPFLSPL